MLVICGKLNFPQATIAFEDNKPMGIYEGEWPTADEFRDILEKGHRPNDKIIFDKDPKKLVSEIIAMVKADKINRASFRFKNPDNA